jgi:hypothetical protein
MSHQTKCITGYWTACQKLKAKCASGDCEGFKKVEPYVKQQEEKIAADPSFEQQLLAGERQMEMQDQAQRNQRAEMFRKMGEPSKSSYVPPSRPTTINCTTNRMGTYSTTSCQ